MLENGPATEARRLLECVRDQTRLNIVRYRLAGGTAAAAILTDIAKAFDCLRTA